MLRSFVPIVRALVSLLSSWWRLDRVRISPREGALLRLQPPCRIRVGSQQADVLTRRQQDRESAVVVYSCNTDRGPATLRIELSDQGRSTSVHWQTAQLTEQLAPKDIEVYAYR